MLAGLILGLAAPLLGQDAAWYSRVVERDLTGDGQREILEVRAVGETSDDLTITFRVIADGRDIYATEWDSRAYFTDDDSGDAERRDAQVRSALAEFFDRGFAPVTHTHPFMGTPLPEAWRPNPESDDPREWIARELRAAGRGDVDAAAVTAIWDEMVGRGALGFSFSTGGQERRRIAWSPRLGRFLVIWSCCEPGA
ncbi:MAG: hypothetical protein O7I93_15130 [Gemmatimonadetes bacterium]|nr:hypothetical protein [Gemmatimonadota bacterium]